MQRHTLTLDFLPRGVWRATELPDAQGATLPTGHTVLDAALPGGGWPLREVIEVLQPQPGVAELRLLSPALAAVAATGEDLVLVGPPMPPHPAGIQQLGIDACRLTWIAADTPLDRLWTVEQLVRAGSAGAIVAWLPRARADQIRRLQVCAQGCDGPVFLVRPAEVAREPSAAPLRVLLEPALDWEIQLQLIKCRGSVGGRLTIPTVPPAIEPILTARSRRPAALIASRRTAQLPANGRTPSHAVDRTAPLRAGV
ncbi:translesion DNA synthesis-associated protein ImuA [Acidovorax sp. SUPP950]|uniref:translesion DNA synthesis-associated protein ImuA n=1 Tax=Acidovorax sp. SUPP950 TaxID=511901 RepID=UPI0024E0A1F4|nr:translesion DNA synthesis-associated protein ImuA [Acidovorax sp. SUPP950]